MVKKITFLVLAIALSCSSCSRYENGPAFSLVTTENRITNSWTYANVLRNGLNITLGEQAGDLVYSSSSMGFAEDGRFSYIEEYRDGDTDRGDGFWEFTDNDTQLKLIYDDVNKTDRTLRVTRLERNFLWLEENLGDNNTLILQMAAN